MPQNFLLSALHLVGFLPVHKLFPHHVHFSEEPMLQIRRNSYLWGGVNGSQPEAQSTGTWEDTQCSNVFSCSSLLGYTVEVKQAVFVCLTGPVRL